MQKNLDGLDSFTSELKGNTEEYSRIFYYISLKTSEIISDLDA